MLILPFKTARHAYIYEAYGNRFARVPEGIYRAFTDPAQTERREAMARRLGLLPEIAPRLSVFPPADIDAGLETLRTQGPTHLVLTVTEACNFRCRYCAYSGAYTGARTHSAQSMSAETLTRAVDWYMGFRRDAYHIGFFGGEPLLRFREIGAAMDRARARVPAGADLTFGMTTNGVLLTPEINAALAERDVALHISLDGPRPVHDRYRRSAGGRPTFDAVWDAVLRLRADHRAYFDASVNIAVTLAPPDPLPAVAAFLDEQEAVFGDRVPKVGLIRDGETILDWLDLEPEEGRLDFEPLRTAFLRACVEGRPPSPLARAVNEAAMRRLRDRISRPLGPVFESHAGQCVPGERCHVDVDGALHMCEHIDPGFAIGHVETGFDESAIRAAITAFSRSVEARCAECWALRLCGRCLPSLSCDGAVSPTRFAAFCKRTRARLKRDMIDFCQSLDENSHCFDGL